MQSSASTRINWYIATLYSCSLFYGLQMKKRLHQTSMTMKNYNGKAMLLLVTILTLAVGVTLSTTMLQQQVSAQNMTAGNNMTGVGNMTGGEAENMTDTEQGGDISSIAINEKGKPADKPVKK